MATLYFLINTLFDIYLMIVLLRIWLQWARADFYNPLSQFIVKATHPILAPMRRVIPSIGSLDLAAVLLALLVALLKFVAFTLLASAPTTISRSTLVNSGYHRSGHRWTVPPTRR